MVGKGAFIMHGTNIGNGSIVGAKSVVKGQFLIIAPSEEILQKLLEEIAHGLETL